MKKGYKEESEPRRWYSRGYLPHFDGGEIVQFVTFRLADSLPEKVISKWQLEFEQELISEIEYHRKIDKYLDKAHGECWLRHPRIAEMVEEALLFHDAKKYKLIEWVIMPNHLHILLKPGEDCSLASIMHSIKSFTAHKANKMLGLTGSFWSKEYFDRYMRDLEHYLDTVAYIHNNPVKAGLCKDYREWRFSSAFRK